MNTMMLVASIVLLGAMIALFACGQGGVDPPTRAMPLGEEAFAEAEKERGMKTATFAAGCFWGVEAAFRKLDGVVATRVGYTGGHMKNPTYKQVCTGDTGHAEAVEVLYNPEKVDYEHLLTVFFRIHDPTTRNRQGPDIGSQYRSVIFYHGTEQKEAAFAMRAKLENEHVYRNPIVTEIEPADAFYQAEDYHQQYLEKNGGANCHIF